jgi:predicted  nucleic acid-binding Zn-ribbon protein
MPFAACVLLGIALGIYAYRAEKSQNAEVAQAPTASTAGSTDRRVEALEQRIGDAGHEREVLRAQLAERDQLIAGLRRETEQEARSLGEMKSAQANLEHSLESSNAEKQQVAGERASLAQKFEATQVSLEKMQSELASARQQRAQNAALDASLEGQIKDLSGQLRDEERAVARQDELLGHDRDIRELMGARDLYVAEVYDVARDGTTQKSYGRMFYTKGKSLIFYAYDLNEEPGASNASVFQAWGRRGPDRDEALNLGLFYEDNAAKKRWVLKFNDAKALDEIDAVFVTVEPSGGSHKPTGKPLLYAYLEIAPNHP